MKMGLAPSIQTRKVPQKNKQIQWVISSYKSDCDAENGFSDCIVFWMEKSHVLYKNNSVRKDC